MKKTPPKNAYRKAESQDRQTVICNQCKKNFKALVSNVKKGNAKFCSLSCAGMYGSTIKPMKTKTCKNCSKRFTTKNTNAVYCSTKCKTQHSSFKRKIHPADKDLIKQLKKRSCEMCDWKEASRDLHHIIPVKEGGSNGPENLITLCPNHHRMADQDMFQPCELMELVWVRRAKIGF